MHRNRVPSSSPYAERIGFSAAVRRGGWVHVAGMSAVGSSGEIVGGADPYAQATEALRKVVDAIEEAGATAADVVRTRIYVTDAGNVDAVGRAHAEAFGDAMPAASMVVVGLLDPRMLVEVEAVAYTN